MPRMRWRPHRTLRSGASEWSVWRRSCWAPAHPSRAAAAFRSRTRWRFPHADRRPRTLAGMDVTELVDGLKAGDRRTVARLISLVEDEAPGLAEIVKAPGPL